MFNQFKNSYRQSALFPALHVLRVSIEEKNAVQATQSICSAYWDSVLDVQTCQN